jgi:hypothetical protein
MVSSCVLIVSSLVTVWLLTHRATLIPKKLIGIGPTIFKSVCHSQIIHMTSLKAGQDEKPFE